MVNSSAELLQVAGLVDEFLNLVDRPELNGDGGVFACLLHPFAENVAYVLGLHVHQQRVLLFVYHYLRCVALHHHRLELRV